MELEEAIERLKRGIEDTMFSTLYSQEQEEEDVKIVLKELEKYRNGEIISIKVLEHYYLVSKDKEKQMTLANKELFKEYVPKKIAEKQEKMIELMSRFIDTELSSEHLSKVLKIDVKPLETYRENIKQYFEKEAGEIN